MENLAVFISILLLMTYSPAAIGRSVSSAIVARTPFHISPDKLYDRAWDSRPMKECNGEENLKSDIGILSFKLSLISSTAGLFSLTEFSFPSNNISIISTLVSLIFWVPSAILTFFAWSDPFSWTKGNLVNLGSLIVTLFGGLGIFTGTADIIVSSVDEVLGITALVLSALTTFPEMFDGLKELLEDILGKRVVDRFLKGYGCGEYKYDFIRDYIRNWKV